MSVCLSVSKLCSRPQTSKMFGFGWNLAHSILSWGYFFLFSESFDFWGLEMSFLLKCLWKIKWNFTIGPSKKWKILKLRPMWCARSTIRRRCLKKKKKKSKKGRLKEGGVYSKHCCYYSWKLFFKFRWNFLSFVVNCWREASLNSLTAHFEANVIHWPSEFMYIKIKELSYVLLDYSL